MTNDEMNGAINRKANIGENREIANGSDLKTAEQDSQFFGELPKGWILKKFGDILSEPVRNGVYKKKEFHGRGLKIINMGELFAYNFISNQEMKRVELNPNEVSKSIVQDGDLLFARRSLVLEGSGKCSLVVHPSENLTFESSIIRARPDRTQADSKFYYYLFQSRLGRALMASIATQTAVSGITGSNLMQLKMPQPPLFEQRKITSILSAYDDLIENNTRRIKILEEMAQALYREWFVKFRFPGHDKVKMVESELGMVPEGWELVKLGDISDINISSIKKGDKLDEINYIDISSVSTGQIDKVEKIVFSEAPSRARRIVKHEDIIWSTVRPNRKSYSMILNPIQNLIVSTGFAVISAIKTPYTYLYFALTTDDFVGYLTNRATGAAYPAVNSGDFKKALVLLPPNPLLESFHDFVADFFDNRQKLHQKDIILRRTRNLLVPKLISGEIDVSNIEIEMGEKYT